MSIATDGVYLDSNTGSRVEKTEWHRVGTLRPGLINMLENDSPSCPIKCQNSEGMIVTYRK